MRNEETKEADIKTGSESETGVDVECRVCHITCNVPATQDQIRKWRGGMLIQKAMPNLSIDQRELLISGLCGTCFDKLFPPDEA